MNESESEPTSPIQGYNSSGEPVGLQTRSRRNALSKSFADTIKPKVRRRSKTLPSVPEDDRADTLNLESGSETSLVWDNYAEKLNRRVDTSRLSTSTQYSVPVGIFSNSSSEEYLDLENVSNQDEHVLDSTVIMSEREIKAHRANLAKVKLMQEDDLSDLNLEEVTISFLKEKLKLADELKELSQAAILFLMEHDDEFNVELRPCVTATKKLILDFIKDGQRVLQAHEQRPEREKVDGTRTISHQIKAERVQQYENKIVGDLNNLVDEFNALGLTDPTTDSACRGLEERFNVLSKRAEIILKDARQLCNDASETGQIEQARSLEKAIRETSDAKIETEVKIHEVKGTMGLYGSFASMKDMDITPPQFTGDLSDKLDFYSFKTEFDEYLNSKPKSRSDQLKLLKRTCLRGTAELACVNMQDVDEIWSYLRETYGNVRILFANKVEELRKLGTCQGSNLKKREWAIAVRSKLNYLHDLCTTHGIEDELYFSPIIGEVQFGLPFKLHEDFKKIFKEGNTGGTVSRRIIFKELLKYMDKVVSDFTFEINYEMGAGKPDQKGEGKPTNNSSSKPTKKNYTGSQTKETKGRQTNSSSKTAAHAQGKYTQPTEVDCVLCDEKHTHLQYCEKFQTCIVKERYKLVGKCNVCFRCLRLDSNLDFNDRETWWSKHKVNCSVDWYCKQGKCANREINKQYHFLLCSWHINDNKDLETAFIKSLNQSMLKPGVRFFFFAPYVYNVNPVEIYKNKVEEGVKILPDIEEPSIFMLQSLAVDRGTVLLFYDSGCMGATVSDRAVSMMDTETVRPGPTFMSVAGGQTIRIESGDERFWLPLEGSKTKATITGLKMPEVTSPFPLWRLQDAWNDVHAGYKVDYPGGEPLPEVPEFVGGARVDIMIGIRYNVYFPTLIYNLPCGLGVYKSKFQSSEGTYGILGGPHKTWRDIEGAANLLGPHSYFTAEARAYKVQGFLLKHNMNMVTTEDYGELLDQTYCKSSLPNEPYDTCPSKHCSEHVNEEGWKIPCTWELYGTRYNIKDEERFSSEMENIGSEAQYRCIRCRNCHDCKKGDILERVSLQEEVEQSLIDSSVHLNVSEKRLEATLPFIADPVANLKPNRFIAEKVLDSQLRAATKNPEIIADILKSHDKLRSKGYVAPYTELSPEERETVDTTPSEYFIPWRTVYNETSLSTPCRMVFDASSRTPGGESLNNILPKGQNKLARILHILIRFRSKRAALTADVRMAYNGVRLLPEYYAYQKYLWKEGLDPNNPTIVMIVKTLIYGVKPAGNQTMVGFSKLADHTLEWFPEHACGAEVLRENAYMDDLLDSEDSEEECKKVAESLEFVLDQGSMSVKAFTFSGETPSELVSADGKHVGLVGLLWDPLQDEIGLDIKELYLGKPKRGKLPELVKGDIGEALKMKFTRRTLVGKCAGVFDPTGLVTPITAGFKLSLHELCKLNLDWDDKVPEQFLEHWVKNLEEIQALREIRFRRSIIPPEAENTDIELVVSVDSSEKIAIAVVHSRVKLRNGEYYCQLVCAKSKLVHTSTVPKGELKAAVLGAVLAHTVKLNLEKQFKNIIYVCDSTIVLYWINQDQRPLQVGVRNAVIEIRRFSEPNQWYHIETHNNIADLGTRRAAVDDIGINSDWQMGKPWMKLRLEEMPLKTVNEVTMTSEERRIAATELKAPDVCGIVLSNLKTKVGDRYSFSNYVVDPCVMTWIKSVRVLGYVFRFIRKLKPGWKKVWFADTDQQSNEWNHGDFQLHEKEVQTAENYFFFKASLEVKQFSKERDWKNVSVQKNGILYYSGRILDGQEIIAVERSMWDLKPLSFVKPIVDRYSPVAYSIMSHCHTKVVVHKNAITTLRESRDSAFILQGRDLANEIRDNCVKCRRFKAKLLQVEMGKLHENRLIIAPPFYYVQVDLLGPMTAICEHNHRSTVEVYGVVFKDTTTSAIAVHVMQGYSTPCFLQAYTRFSSRYGHPTKLFIDEGSQLMKACRKMEINIVDLTRSLNASHQVGVEYSVCPVGGHNAHGIVERSIREVKKLFKLVYSGLKLDITSYETAFAWISNELNGLPICLGSRTDGLEHSDLITPNRLLLGRNNRRALGGYAKVSGPSRLMDQMENVYKSWWTVWKNEKLLDYIPQPKKWQKNNGDVKIGDVVIFLKSDKDQTLGEPRWKMGRIKDVETSKDGLVRVVIIEYKNSTESIFRTTRRSARTIAVLHREGELEMIEELNEASRQANLVFFMFQGYGSKANKK